MQRFIDQPNNKPNDLRTRLADALSTYSKGEYPVQKAIRGFMAPVVDPLDQFYTALAEKMYSNYPNVSTENKKQALSEVIRMATMYGMTQKVPANASPFVGNILSDATDQPIPLYHGTKHQFQNISNKALGKNTGAPSATQGHFFATNKSLAEDYALMGDSPYAEKLYLAMRSTEKKAQIAQDMARRFAKTGGIRNAKEQTEIANKLFKKSESLMRRYESRIMGEQNFPQAYKGNERQLITAYAKMKKPYVYDFKGSPYREESYFDIIKKAKERGHDGVILKNTYDDVSANLNKLTDIVVVFKPKQVITHKIEKLL